MACSHKAVTIGRHLARELFDARGNHSEVHLSEVELAALLTLAVERSELPAEFFEDLLGQGRR
jgi:hypothetical protein